MHLRKASCRGGHYGTDQSAAAHGPHEFFPHSWAEAIRCPGWSEEEAAASAVVEQIAQYAHEHPRADETRLEAHPAVLAGISRLLVPIDADTGLATVTDDAGIEHQLTRLFGVPLAAAPLGPGEWRLVLGGGTDG
jgi:hypothetical protein